MIFNIGRTQKIEKGRISPLNTVPEIAIYLPFKTQNPTFDMIVRQMDLK